MISFSNYMVQHVLYINGIQKCLKQHTEFNHKKPTECAFGKMFYADIKPKLDEFPKNKQDVIHELEQTHTAFHNAALRISHDNSDIEAAKQDAWLYSSKLINLLNGLEKM